MTTSTWNPEASPSLTMDSKGSEPGNQESPSSGSALPAFRPNAPSQDLSPTAPSQIVSRCLHRYANGKRCRLPGLASLAGFCSRHIHIDNLNVAVGLPLAPLPSDSEDLSADLLPELSQPDSSLPIKQFRMRLLILLTKGRITPRRAAVLSYLTNQLVHVSSRRSP